MRKCMPRIIFSSMNGINKDIDPASELREEDEDSSLPELEMESATAGHWPPAVPRSHGLQSSPRLPPASTA